MWAAVLDRTHKKLREAEFFLGLLIAADSAVMKRGPEDPDFYLSAFLTAARSVTFAMSKDHGESTEEWTVEWISRLSAADAALMRFFVKQRNKVQKEGSADIEVTFTTVSLTEFVAQLDAAGGAYFGSYMPGIPQPTASRPETRFRSKPHVSVGAVCQSYLDLLKRLVLDFEHGSPEPKSAFLQKMRRYARQIRQALGSVLRC